MNHTKNVLSTVSKMDARRCIIMRHGSVRSCEVADNGSVEKYLIRMDEYNRILHDAAGNGLLCICDDASAPGYAVAAYDLRRGCWVRFESNIASVAKLEPYYRKRVAG